MTVYQTYDFDDNTTQHLGPWFDATCAADAASAHDGSYGLLITPAAGFWGIQTDNYPGWATPVASHTADVVTGISVWLKAETAGGTGDIGIDVEWHDVTDAYTTTTSFQAVPAASNAPTTWTKYTGSFTIPSGSYHGFTIIAGSSWTAGKIMLDSLVIGDLVTPPPNGLQIWDGSAWVAANDGVVKAKVWNGSAWA